MIVMFVNQHYFSISDCNAMLANFDRDQMLHNVLIHIPLFFHCAGLLSRLQDEGKGWHCFHSTKNYNHQLNLRDRLLEFNLLDICNWHITLHSLMKNFNYNNPCCIRHSVSSKNSFIYSFINSRGFKCLLCCSPCFLYYIQYFWMVHNYGGSWLRILCTRSL